MAELRTDEFGFGFFGSFFRFNRTNLHIRYAGRRHPPLLVLLAIVPGCCSLATTCLGWPCSRAWPTARWPSPQLVGRRGRSLLTAAASWIRCSLLAVRPSTEPMRRSPPPCCRAEDLLRDPHHHRPGVAPPAAAAIGRVRSRRCARAGVRLCCVSRA